MPGIRALAIAIGLGLGVGAYAQAWLHWPTFLAVAIGAVMAIVLLLLAASLGEDAAAADAAWREAAADLVGRPPTRKPDEPAAGGPPTAPRARPRTRAELEARLRQEGLDPAAWSNGPGDRYAAHEHGYDKVIVVADGSIRFGLPARGEGASLAAGDRLELPAGTSHDATVGPAGVTCLEAHAPAGTLSQLVRRGAGSW